MPPVPEMTVSITFQSPAHENGKGGWSLHERRLQAVPKANAQRMVEDFTTYQSEENGDRRKLYRYENEGHERLVALDFEEVVALVASVPESA